MSNVVLTGISQITTHKRTEARLGLEFEGGLQLLPLVEGGSTGWVTEVTYLVMSG